MRKIFLTFLLCLIGTQAFATTYYVTKSGSNSHGCTNETSDACLTISYGLGKAGNTDTVVVGSGLYSERISRTDMGATVSADGVVVMDGTAQSGSGQAITWARSGAAGGVYNWTFNTVSTGGRWIFQNWNTSSTTYGIAITSGSTGGGVVYYNMIFYNTDFIGNSNNQIALSATSGSNVVTSFQAYNSTFSTFSTGAVVYANTNSSYPTFDNCTFYNNGTAIDTHVVSGITAFRNIFVNNTLALYESGNPGSNSDYNDFYNNTTVGKISSTSYTTLANWQAVGSGLDAHSITTSYLIDPANQVFFLNASPSISNLGAWPYSNLTNESNFDPNSQWNITNSSSGAGTGWYNASGNITLSSGNFVLNSGTSDTIASVVYNTGVQSQQMTEVDVVSLQTWQTNMVDYDSWSTSPHYQSVEVRASNTSFNQSDASPSWTVVNMYSPITSIKGQYQQVRLTLRTNDTAG